MCAFFFFGCLVSHRAERGNMTGPLSTQLQTLKYSTFDLFIFPIFLFCLKGGYCLIWINKFKSISLPPPKKCHGTNGVSLITFWDDATFASLCLFVSGRSWLEGQMARDLKISTSAVTRALVWQRINITLWEEEEEEPWTVDCLLFKDKRHFEKRCLRWQKT